MRSMTRSPQPFRLTQRTAVLSLFFILFTMLYLPLFYPLSASAIPEVRMENVEVTPNSMITIPIIIHNVENLGSGTINMIYNPSIVRVVNVKSGTGNALEVQSWNADNTKGIVRIVAWSANESRSGDVIFANVTLKAVGHALEFSYLNISVYDLTEYYNYTKIQCTVRNGSILVRPSPGEWTSEGDGGGFRGGYGGYMPLTTPTPQPTAAGTPQTLPLLSPTPTYFVSPTPASELTPTPVATTPLAPFPTIKWFIIIAIIAGSAIIVTVLYLILRRSKE